MPDCWNCGCPASVIAVPGYHHKYRCTGCDVEWVTEQAWDGNGRWESYEAYTRSLRKADRNNAREYGVEYVDFGKSDAPHTP